jgi:cell division protein ZapB
MLRVDKSFDFNPPKISAMHDLLAERIERLLVRHNESRRTVALLEQQVASLTAERDSLQSRLQAASLRIEAVMLRLPEISAPQPEEAVL